MLERTTKISASHCLGLAALICAALVFAAPAAADDRDLLREATGSPYVFIVFDTSGSMNLSPKCSQASFDAGDCDFLCPDGDCFVPRNGDDPNSKFYQAKEVLHEVVSNIGNIQFGFASYNQDELRVKDKHWLYQVSAVNHNSVPYTFLTLDSGSSFPAVGDEEVFGATWTCAEGNGFAEVGCHGSATADIEVPLELRRVQRLPKLGRDMNEEVRIYVEEGNDDYEVIYRPLAELSPGVPNAYGNPIFAADVEVRECTNNSCTSTNPFDRQTIYYELVGDFIAWDRTPDSRDKLSNFFGGDAGEEVSSLGSEVANSCDGWDDNDDDNQDPYPNQTGYNLRWPTDNTDPRDDPRRLLDFGDRIPLDWNPAANHKADVLDRLGPGGSFGMAPLFRDQRQGTDDFLRLNNDVLRPLVANGDTPLGEIIRDFRTWYSGCDHGNCPKDSGWEDLAAALDPDWACRKKYLVVITDGDDSCRGPDACSATAGLRSQAGVKSYVVAFGVENTSHNRLNCMAANGGTGDPIYPENKAELKQALIDIFNEIRVEARSFASASVPTVQNETSDKIYLSSFTPFKDISVWPGRIDAYRKPLPLNDDDTPFLPPTDGGACTRCCSDANLDAACWLWNAAEELLDQAPTPAEADMGDYKIGNGVTKRRVIYSWEADPNDFEPNVPNKTRLFLPADVSDPAESYELWRGLGIIPPATKDNNLSGAAEATAQAESLKVIGNTVKIKTHVEPDPAGIDPPEIFEYVMGDVFHADPEILNSPNHLVYFREDLNGYREFAEKNFWRRKMLVVAANDGQLHFFDAGIRKLIFDPSVQRNVPRFTDGTGIELFSFMPRLAMPVVGDQFDGSPVSDPEVMGNHIFSLDGSLTIADVHIDPLHDGTNNRANDRGWRTVIVSGLREGGNVMFGGRATGFKSGFFALDVTQPDVLVKPSPTPQDPDPDWIPTPVGSLLPSCLVVDETTGDHNTHGSCETPAGSDFQFPVELWSFTDRIGDPGNSDRDLFALDEDDVDGDGDPDGNGFPDLGDTWSKPVVGQIQVCNGASCDPLVVPNDVERRFVAIFGGGLDPASPNTGRRGNWLYMVDVETGREIYKRQLDGSAAAGVATIDRDQDGLLDVVYVPTTGSSTPGQGGFLYKVELSRLTATGEVPRLVDVAITNDHVLGSPLPGGYSHNFRRVIDAAWDPVPIFNAEGRPLYQTPTALFVPGLDQYALAFGTGNRHDLWESTGIEGRFYNIVDEDYDAFNLPTPLVETDFENIRFDAVNAGGDLLTSPPAGKNRGWVLQLEADDRVITQAFSLVSVMVFSTFKPFSVLVDENLVCARTGESRIFVVDATNADAFIDLDVLSTTTVERFLSVGDFTTSPYVDQTATKNPRDPNASDRDTESVLDERQQDLQTAIRDSLKRFFPEGCRYNESFSLTVNASRSDTGFVRYATIPIAVCPVDWKGR